VQDGNGNQYLSFDAADWAEIFYKAIVDDMETQFSGVATLFPKLGLADSTAYASLSATAKLTNIAKLAEYFAQVPYFNNEVGGSEYFGKYGPLSEQKEQTYLPLETIIFDISDLTPPTITMQIPTKRLANDEDLLVLISTNIEHDTDLTYILQVSHKEKILHQEVLDL
jgi:hypothetical protein